MKQKPGFLNSLPTLPTLGAFFAGAVSWQMVSYWRRLLRQPTFSLASRLPAEKQSMAHEALHIAIDNVRTAIEERLLPDGRRRQVLCAGLRNFREPWARDFSFASFGLVELNELRTLRETLEVFLLNQTAVGQFPVKVHSTSVLDRYLHSLFNRHQPIRNPLRPKYITAHNTISLDGNALLVIAALNYLRRGNDHAFASTYWANLKQALRWLEQQSLATDGLLYQGAYTDWADSIVRMGHIHYTNVLHWKAVHDFAREAAQYGYDEDAAYFLTRANQLRETINTHFWRDDLGYYVTSQEYDLLSSDGNLLAIAWGLATPYQANAILDEMQARQMANPVPTQVTDRSYILQHIALENRLAGIPHYHTSAAWLWLGSWHVIALVQAARLPEAQQLLERLDRLITHDKVVHEVYDRNGRYLSTFWYTSEAPLTWSAGMFVYARAVYQRAVSSK